MDMGVFEEIDAIHKFLDNVVFPARPCLWSNNILMEDQSTWLGIAYFNGDIGIQTDLLENDDLLLLLHATVIHEMLHMYSVGYHPDAYSKFIGWEEGVVEQLQRLVRPTVLKALGYVESDSPLLTRKEEEHAYAPYIYALEAIRSLLGQEEWSFYYSLHSLPLSQRPFTILEQIRNQFDRKVVDAFMFINDILLTDITKPVELVRIDP